MIIGANAKLSKEIAKQLSIQNVELTLLAQHIEELLIFANTLNNQVHCYELDLYQPNIAANQLNAIWKKNNGFELILVNTGIHFYDPNLPWEPEQQIIQINVQGFSLICNCIFNLIKNQGFGQLAAINSIAGIRGGASVAYHASKAFAQNYLEGLSMHAQRLHLPITITDIQLGLIDKAAMQQNQFWTVSINKVAIQIINALKQGKRKAYIPKRWLIIVLITKLLPEFIYNTRNWKAKKRHRNDA